MSFENKISLDDLLNEFDGKTDEQAELMITNIGNLCSSLSFLTSNINSIESTKLIKLLKFIRKQQLVVNQNIYRLIEILSNDDKNFIYNDYLNGFDEHLLHNIKNESP